MPRNLDRFTTALSALLVLGALLACKKKTPVPSGAGTTTSVAATPAPPASPAAPPAVAAPETAAPAPRLGEVKRYPDKEKAQTGAARILDDGVKVFNEADDKTADVATLDKGSLVFRLASIPDWELVEFPSGVGKVAPGWVQAKLVDLKSAAAVPRDAIAAQSKPRAVSSAAPKASGSAAVAASAQPVASGGPTVAEKLKALRAAQKAKAAAGK